MNADHRVCIALLFVVVVGLMSLKGGMHESFFDYDYGPVAALQTDVSNVKGTVSALSLVVARNTRDLQVARQFTTPAAPAVAVAAASVAPIDLSPIRAQITGQAQSLVQAETKVNTLSAQFQTMSSQVSSLSNQVGTLGGNIAGMVNAHAAPVAAVVAAPVVPAACADCAGYGTRITTLEAELVTVQNQSAMHALPPASYQLQDGSGAFMNIQPNSVMRNAGSLLSIGQATDISANPATGIVQSDVRIGGQPDIWHGVAFGGTANDPVYNTIIAERKVKAGQSELLFAKFKDFNNGQGPDQIRHFAPQHVFATFPDGTSVINTPADMPSAFNTIDNNNKVMMQIDATGVVIGNHKFVSTGSTLNVCDSNGNNCKNLY